MYIIIIEPRARESLEISKEIADVYNNWMELSMEIGRNKSEINLRFDSSMARFSVELGVFGLDGLHDYYVWAYLWDSYMLLGNSGEVDPIDISELDDVPMPVDIVGNRRYY